MITITTTAEKQIETILSQEVAGTNIRAFVQGGGCSGFQYGFTLDTETHSDDHEINVGVYKVIIDAVSLQYMSGSTLDYRGDFMSKAFVIDNPNAVSTCGCGSSFRID